MKSFKKLVITISILLLGLSNGFATNLGMMELTYRHISGTTYELTLIVFTTCNSATPTSTLGIRAKSTSLSVNTIAGTLTRLPISGPGTPSLIPQNMYNCSNLGLCWEEYVYRGTINLANLSPSPYAADWEFSYQRCCVTIGAITPRNITGGHLYAVCGLNNLDFPEGNDAPIWHDRRPNRPGHVMDTVINYPGRSVCACFPTIIDQSVVEYEGDDIRYEFVRPLTINGTPATYINGFDLTIPIPFKTPPGFSFDTINGTMEFVGANSIHNVFLLGLRAVEYRLDTDTIAGIPTSVSKEIGFIYRNFYLVIEPDTSCPDKSIELKKAELNLECNAEVIEIETTKKYQCKTADKDGSFVLIKEKITGDTISIDSVEVNSCFANSISKSFSIHLNKPINPGKYTLVLQNGTDGNTLLSECGTEMAAYSDTIFLTVDTFDVAEIITIKDSNSNYLSTLIGNCGTRAIKINFTEPVRCNSIDTTGNEFVIIDSTKTPPSSVNVSAVRLPNCNNGFVSALTIDLPFPFTNGKYELKVKKSGDGNTFLNECGVETPQGSFPILVSDPQIDLGPDLTYCKDSAFTAKIGETGYSRYTWSTGHISAEIIIDTAGVYTLEVDNGFGCKDRDTVVVTEIDCGGGVGITEITLMKFSIYPNPTKSFISIQSVNRHESLQVTLLDLSGQMVKEKVIKNPESLMKIDVQDVPSGMYLLQIRNENSEVFESKLLVQP